MVGDWFFIASEEQTPCIMRKVILAYWVVRL